jgi:hypothetical protein
MRQRIFPVLFVLAFPTWTDLLQGAQGRGTSRGSTAGSTRPSPSVLPYPDQRNAPTLFITGAVLMEDGTPAPTRTRVECVCSSRTKRSTTVDSQGSFSLQIGGSARYSTLIPDSSDDAPGSTDIPPSRAGRRFGLPATADSMAAASLMGCELRATVDTFRSNTVVLQGVKNLGQIDVGTVILYPIARVSGTLVSVTSLQAPKEARKALGRAEKSLEKRNFEKAEKELKKAVEAYPKYAAAWFAIGQICEQERHFQDARDAYQKAVAADGNYVRPYVALARLAGIERHWKEVAEITDHVVALDPLDFPEAYYLNSMAYYSLKKMDAAERSARKVLRLDPLHRIPAAYLILADILEQKQDFAGSIEQLRSYLQILPTAPSADFVRARIRELEESLRKG